MVAQGVTRVAGIVSHPKNVVVRFGSDEKNAVFGHVGDAIRPCLNMTLQLISSFLGQLV